MSAPRVVVIGGGFGGLAVARRLESASVRVTVVDRANHHLFQPLLYQVAMAGLSPAEIAVPIRSALKDQPNAEVILAEATAVDLASRTVSLADAAPLSYDYLVIAAGAKTNWFGNDAWSLHALGLKTLDDAIEIRRRVLLAFEAAEREDDGVARGRLLTFVVIGGGPTGVEVAGALSELGGAILAADFRKIRGQKPRVVLVEAAPRLLPGGFHPSLAQSAKRQLEELGVEVRLGRKVIGVDARGVSLEDGLVESTTVLWTAGVRAKRIGATLGVPLDGAGRIRVTADCSIAGHPEAFAIGDVACFVPEGEERPLPGVSPVAMQQGRHVATRIRRLLRGEPGSEPFRYVDKGIMATIGRRRAVAQTGRLRLSGLLAWLAWLFVHIWYLIDFRNRLVVLLDWAYGYFTYHRGSRLITGDRAWERVKELASRAEHAGDDNDDDNDRGAPRT